MPKNVGDLGKLIVAKSFKKLPKVQKISQSGHTGDDASPLIEALSSNPARWPFVILR